MRKATREEKRRLHRDNLRKGRRSRVVLLTKTTSMSGKKIAKITKRNKEKVRRIRKAVAEGDSTTLDKFLDPSGNRAGPRPVMSDAEERMIAHRLIYAESRRFAVGKCQLQRLMGQIAADERLNRYKDLLPSMSNIRRFRAHHRELTYRNS